MIERDFILRMIQEIGNFIARLLKLKKMGQPSKAYEEIKIRIPKLTGITYKELVSDETSVEDLAIDANDPEGYLNAKGQFFLVAGELCLDLNKRGEAQKLFEAGIHYYTYAVQHYKTFSFQRQVDLEKLKNYMDLLVAQ